MWILFSRLFLVLSLAIWPVGSPALKVERKKSSYELPKSSEQFKYIRVYLFGGIRELSLQSFSAYEMSDKNGRKLFSGNNLQPTLIRSTSKGIQFGVQTFDQFPLHLESQGEGFKIQGHTYRHILQIWRETDGTLLIVNEIPIEDYLKSVLPSEMSAEWSYEALKAQAIASRTYALFKMIENHQNKYDLRKDVISQAYKGKALEHIATTRALRETQGQILSYRGRVFLSFFHSTCGGRTANIADLWDMEPHPCLKGVDCDFCRLSRHYRWNSQISRYEVEKKMKAAGYSVFGLQNFEVGAKDKGKRAKTIIFKDSKGKKTIIASDFRFIAGPDKIKSTLIEKIEKKGDTFFIRGRGWGHGAGLCQYGARRLSELGYVARQIIRYYYPDSEITQFWP